MPPANSSTAHATGEFDGFVRSTNIEYEAADGTTLSANVFRPTDADSVPALLQRTPYGAPDFPTSPFAIAALDAGYGVVIADVRGRGQSDGKFEPWVHERSDGRETVAWVADQDWCDGSVGMFGGSSAATTQLMAAAERPAGLDAICPQFAPSDIHGSDFFQDGAMSALTLISWSFGWIAPHTAQRLEARGDIDAATKQAIEDACFDALEEIPDLTRHRPLVSVPERVFADVDLPVTMAPGDLVPHWDRWLSHPTYDDFWASFDAEQLYDAMAVPALHVTGWHDLCQDGTVTNYLGLTDATDATQHLVVGPWAHRNQSDRVGDVDFGPRADAERYGLTQLKLDFFDAHLREGDADLPAVETFAMSPSGGEWVRDEEWPPADSEPTRLHLAVGDGETHHLTAAPPRDPDHLTYEHDPTDPIQTRGGPLCCRDATSEPGMFEQPLAPDRDDVLVFETPPLEEAVTIAGRVALSVLVDSTRPETDVTAKLLHVTDDGAYNVADGIRRTSYDRDGQLDGPTRLTVDCWQTHHRVPAGDRIAVQVASSNWPRFDPHPGTTDPWTADADDVTTSTQTLFTGGETQSWLSLPTRD